MSDLNQSLGGKKAPKILSRSQIIEYIANGKAIVIYKNNVLNLTNWIPYHPGGNKAILHMVGRDATDEMIAYHGEDTVQIFTKWKIGEINYKWDNLLPPIQGADYSKGHECPNQQTTKHMAMKELINNKLDTKLDGNSSSEDSEAELITSSRSSLDLDNDEKPLPLENKGIGFPKGFVTPKVPQNVMVTNENKHELFPLYENQTVVNPKHLMDKYDNQLTHNDILNLPDLDYDTQERIRDSYNQLHATIIKKGLYKCDYWNYFRELVKISSLLLYSFSLFKLGYIKMSAILLGMAWQQGTFVVHDAGHLSITHDYYFDNLFGIFIADFIGGLSIGWWKTNHNVHHLITNDPVHDPDIQHLPFFAVSTRLFNNVYSTYYDRYLYFDVFAKGLIKIQNYMYYPILIFARFNLYRLSWSYLLGGGGPRKGQGTNLRYVEFVGLSFFSYWYFYLILYKLLDTNWLRFQFLMLTNIASFIVHVQITLSHFAMSTTDLGVSESFPMRQIRTTMDVDCPKWLDFFHGGLQFQAVHHLFPRLPRHNLRAAQSDVIKFCQQTNMKYSIYGFGEGNEIVINKLADIGKQCGIMLDAVKKLDHNDMF